MVLLTNTTGGVVTIDDMGIVLQPGEEVDIELNFDEKQILDSEDLEPAIVSGDIEASITDFFVPPPNSHSDVVEYFRRLTEYEHLKLDQLVHGLSEESYFEAAKDVNNRTQFITYYKDAAKTIKIREEEITRQPDKKAASIIIRQYDENGALLRTETQTLNRNVQGKVESIDSEVV